MVIASIADHHDLVETIGKWHWNEWGHVDPDGTLETWIERLANRTGRDTIPTTYVALSDGGDLLGSVSLVDCDMETRPDLWPWLAGLFVRPDARNCGVGSALVTYATKKVREMGIQTLYLYTSSSESLYSKLGWSTIDREGYESKNVAIMSTRVA